MNHWKQIWHGQTRWLEGAERTPTQRRFEQDFFVEPADAPTTVPLLRVLGDYDPIVPRVAASEGHGSLIDCLYGNVIPSLGQSRDVELLQSIRRLPIVASEIVRPLRRLSHPLAGEELEDKAGD